MIPQTWGKIYQCANDTGRAKPVRGAPSTQPTPVEPRPFQVPHFQGKSSTNCTFDQISTRRRTIRADKVAAYLHVFELHGTSGGKSSHARQFLRAPIPHASTG